MSQLSQLHQLSKLSKKLLFAALLSQLLLGLSPIGLLPQALAADEPTEEPGLTPLSDFAPDEVRPARGETYDQGLTIRKVNIEGNRLIEEDKIKGAMSIKPGSLYSKRNLQQDLKRIYELGYFTEKIKAVPVATNAGIVIRIEVEENAPVTGVNIEGNTVIKDEEIQKIFAGQTGLPQNIGQLNESIEKIEKLYADKGYILTRVKSISDDPDGVINLEVNEGFIDKVQFVGNRKTKDYVLRRSLFTKAGDIYNEKYVAEDLKRLYSSQAFSDVRRVITASPDSPDKYNLTIELDEKKTGAISLGGGVDSTTGLFGSFGFNDPNFLGRGHSFTSAFSVGTGVIGRNAATANTRIYQFDVGYSAPAIFNTDNSISTGIYGRDLSSFNVPLAVERRFGTDFTLSRPIKSVPNMAASLALRGENVRLKEGGSNSDLRRFGGLTQNSQARKDQLQGGTYLTLAPTIAYDTRDNRFNPTSGWLSTGTVTGAYGLGSTSYASVSANIRKYFKIRDGITLALNAQGGTSGLGDIPEFNMFRLGGSYSVRGFQEGGLGVGNGFLLGSAELRTKVPLFGKLQNVPLLDTMRTAFFLDAGSLLGEPNTNKFFDRPGFGASIGAGLRINIPGVGPIRLDYAIPIAGGSSRYTRNFNFGVGQKF